MPTPETFGRYQLLKLLARGGMGEVWLARQPGLQGFEKLVVIKRLLPHLAEDDEFVHMFLDEGRIAARLNHPNVVQIFDLGREGDYYFLTMEYVHGDDVRRIWKAGAKAGRPIPPELACRIVADAAAGLDFAHKKADDKGEPLQIVHRDISPHNIIVTFDGGVKVIDFGIARARGRISHTATGALKGRFEYMSPEHAAGQEVDHRTDLFALGVVLWETLTGRRLFKRDGETQTLLAVGECDVPAPSTLNPDLPPGLDEIVLKALAKNRDDRYEDCAAFRLALEDWIVSARQSASSAHLAAFMRDVYAERLTTEARLGHPVFEEITDSRAQPMKQGAGESETRVSQKTSPEPSANSAVTEHASVPPVKKQGSRAPVAVAAAVVVVAAIVVAVLATRKAAPVPAPPVAVAPVAPPPVAVAPPPPPAPTTIVAAQPTTVLKSFASDPAGAEVLLDGMMIGRTPLQWSLPFGETPHKVEFRLAGHKPALVETTAVAADAVVAKLERAEASPKPGPKTPPPTNNDIILAR